MRVEDRMGRVPRPRAVKYMDMGMASQEPEEPEGQADAGAEDTASEPQGVFGNLPQTRPGSRSPHRQRAKGQGEADQAAKAAAPEPELDPPTAARSADAGAAGPAAGGAPGGEGPQPADGGGLEEVAWAGVAAAAEAATIGVRLATRALERMRDAVDPR